jgi:hypothetical protein
MLLTRMIMQRCTVRGVLSIAYLMVSHIGAAAWRGGLGIGTLTARASTPMGPLATDGSLLAQGVVAISGDVHELIPVINRMPHRGAIPGCEVTLNDRFVAEFSYAEGRGGEIRRLPQ